MFGILRTQFAAMGRRLWVLDVTSDIGIPVVVAVLHWKEDGQERVEFAAGADFDLRVATLRAVTGLNQILAVDRMTCPAAASAAADKGDALPVPLRKHAYLMPRGKATTRRAETFKFAGLDRRDQIHGCVKLAKRLGLDVLVLDQTRPDVGVPVVRVIVPGLRHFHRRFAPGRLYDVPVKLGFRKRALREADLNPLDPRMPGFREVDRRRIGSCLRQPRFHRGMREPGWTGSSAGTNRGHCHLTSIPKPEMAMTIARILSTGAAAALIVLGSAALAEDTHTGMITGINRLNDSIAIRQTQSGTVGTNTGAPEQFKVQKGVSLEDIHAGDKVTFSATAGAEGIRTVTNLKKQ